MDAKSITLGKCLLFLLLPYVIGKSTAWENGRVVLNCMIPTILSSPVLLLDKIVQSKKVIW
jgi:hypothetical protein